MPHEEERSPGQVKRPQEAGREKWRRRLWEVGGEGRDPEPKEQGEIPCRSPPSPPTSPLVLNTAASQEDQNWKVSAHNLGRGPGSLLCLPLPHEGSQGQGQTEQPDGGWGAGLVLNVHLAPQQQETSTAHYSQGDTDTTTATRDSSECSPQLSGC